MTLPASLIVVSRHRTAALLRALAGVTQMDHPEFEVIVVCDPQAAREVRGSGLAVKLAVFDEPNISAARNVGLGLASAPVVAFLDDDAVPEPTWLRRLVAPFDAPEVTAATGYVLGRSGLAWQWRATFIGVDALDDPFDAPQAVSLHPSTPERTVKTQGTNCAFRRDALLAIGGFDPGFAFYLDDADVALRLGGVTAVVPDAVVHHGFAASARRRADRVPTDLAQIGTSLALFLRRHAGGDTSFLRPHIADQRRRALRHMVSGALEPRDVARLMASLRSGIDSGLGQPLSHLPPLRATTLPLTPLPGTGPRAGIVLYGMAAQGGDLMAKAKAAKAQGRIVTLILLERGIRAHRHWFQGGIWFQTGGRRGRSWRTGPRIVWQTAESRIQAEVSRLAAFRPVSDP